MLIKYKHENINLANVLHCFWRDLISSYEIYFVGIGGEVDEDCPLNIWTFNSVEERDKVYNYIIKTYFVDIEQSMNDNLNEVKE